MKYSDNTICVLGLGYVGLTLSVTLASIGFNVYGIEIRKKVISDLKKKKPHFYEPGLLDALKKVIKKRFNYSNNSRLSILSQCNIIFNL